MTERLERIEEQIDDFAVELRNMEKSVTLVKGEIEAGKQMRSQLVKEFSEKITKMAEVVQKLQDTVYGNGKEGITTKVERISTQIKSIKWTIVTAVSVSSLIVHVVLKVLLP